MSLKEFSNIVNEIPPYELRSLYHNALIAMAFAPENKITYEAKAYRDIIEDEIERRGGFGFKFD